MKVKETFENLKKEHEKHPYPAATERKRILMTLKQVLKHDAKTIGEAISKDFSQRCVYETYIADIFSTINAIDYCYKHIPKWMKQRKRNVSWLYKPAKAALFPQPLGVVGIVVPWNYPIQLALVPAVYAISAGNRAMVKMSEYTPETGALLKKLLEQEKLDDYISIINGDVEVAKSFVSLPFGHLLYTGSTKVGKQVMRAASENLTPVTLELGGKSPVIVSKTAHVDNLNRIFYGKTLNAGQTCIAPDYIFVAKEMIEKFESAWREFYKKHYPKLIDNDDYSSIISDAQKNRALQLLEDAKSKGAKIIQEGEQKEDNRKLPMHLILDVTTEMKIMQEEIFGPILPVMVYQSIDEVIQYINQRPNPLALYYFGFDKDERKALKYRTLSGSFVINDTIMHNLIDDLPFGGVGHSGMGAYHGKEGFDIFSQLKPIFIQRKYSAMKYFLPPYGRLVKLFLRKVGGIDI